MLLTNQMLIQVHALFSGMSNISNELKTSLLRWIRILSSNAGCMEAELQRKKKICVPRGFVMFGAYTTDSVNTGIRGPCWLIAGKREDEVLVVKYK